MKKLNALAILTLLATFTLNSTHARPGQWDGGQRGQEVESFVGKRILPHQVLHVRKELSLNDHKGKVLKSVSVEAMSRSRVVTATLYIGDRQVSRPQTIHPSYDRRFGDSDFITFDLKRPFVIGQGMGSVQVKFSSVVFVDRVSAVVQKHRRTSIYKKDVYKFQAGIGQQMDLASALGMGERRAENTRVAKVKLSVRSLVGSTHIQLCRANGKCIASKTVTERDGQTSVVLDPQRSPKLSRLHIKTSGIVFIKSLAVTPER